MIISIDINIHPRKSEPNNNPRRGLFIGDPAIESCVGQMINHAHELAHWVSAEILSCGSQKVSCFFF